MTIYDFRCKVLITKFRVMKKLLIVLFLTIFFSFQMLAQIGDSVNRGLWVPRDFGRYFVSDIYSPVTKLQLGSGSNGTDYNNDPQRTTGHIALGEFTLGADIPLYSGHFRLADEDFRFSVTSSISAVILFDILNKKSSPILNVDYRLELMDLFLLKEFRGRYLKNVLLRIAPFQHESTHIGDELTLYRKEAGFPITRINVSYDSGEISCTLNDPAGKISNNHAFTLGGRLLYRGDKTDGFYTMQSSEGDLSFFVPSSRRLEGYFRYQYDSPGGPFRIGRFFPVVSAELRQRVKFGYNYYEADPSSASGFREITRAEKYAPCLNLYAGWRDRGKSGHPGRIGGFFRYYSGINPHGQFRNIPRYTFFGFAVVYEN